MNQAVLTGDARQQRRVILEPMILHLRSVLTRQAEHQGGLKFAIKHLTIEIASWDRVQLQQTLDPAQSGPESWRLRMLEAVAVQARGFNDLIRLAAPGPPGDEQRQQARRDLVHDLALGLAIQSELERIAELLGAAGKSSAARNLSLFQQRLSRSLDQMREALTDVEIESAASLSSDFMRPADESVLQTGPQLRIAVSEDRAPAPESDAGAAVEESAAPRRRTVKRVHAVAAGALTAVVVAGSVFLAPKLTHQYRIEHGMRYVPGIEHHVGAPPRMTVTVSPAYWRSVDGPAKTRLMFAVAAAIERKGFTSAAFVTPDGMAVGDWDKEQGVRHD